MDKLTVMKIPEEILKNINKKRNKEYVTRIDKNDIFNEQNVSKTAMDLICYFEYNYWMDDNKKREIERLHKKRIQEMEVEKSKKYNYNNLFSKLLYNVIKKCIITLQYMYILQNMIFAI